MHHDHNMFYLVHSCTFLFYDIAAFLHFIRRESEYVALYKHFSIAKSREWTLVTSKSDSLWKYRMKNHDIFYIPWPLLIFVHYATTIRNMRIPFTAKRLIGGVESLCEAIRIFTITLLALPLNTLLSLGCSRCLKLPISVNSAITPFFWSLWCSGDSAKKITLP
jgi:hypothetical protein